MRPSSFWFLPETLIAVRCVVIAAGHRRRVDAREVEIDAVERVAARGDEVRVRLVEDERRVDRAVGADRARAHVERRRPGVAPSSLTTACTDEVISADLISSGVHVGCAALTSAETPAACGLDIDVPAIAMYRLPGGPLSAVVWSGCGVVPGEHLDARRGDVRLDPVAGRAARREATPSRRPVPGCAVPCAHVAITFVWPVTKMAIEFELNWVWIAGR